MSSAHSTHSITDAFCSFGTQQAVFFAHSPQKRHMLPCPPHYRSCTQPNRASFLLWKVFVITMPTVVVFSVRRFPSQPHGFAVRNSGVSPEESGLHNPMAGHTEICAAFQIQRVQVTASPHQSLNELHKCCFSLLSCSTPTKCSNSTVGLYNPHLKHLRLVLVNLERVRLQKGQTPCS